MDRAPQFEPRTESRPVVLVVDDEAGPRQTLGITFSGEFDVLFAETGHEGLELLRKHPVDAVTLDLHMPGISGEATLALMKEVDPDLQAVIVTAFCSLESLLETLRLRAFDCVTKPFDSSKMIQVVKQATAERRRRRDRERHAEELLDSIASVLESSQHLEQNAWEKLSEPERAAVELIQAEARRMRDGVSAVMPPRAQACAAAR
jgi:two-component system, sensor histidine kinase and response regulator